MIKNDFLPQLVILLLLLTGCRNTSRSITSSPTPTPVAAESIAIYTPLYIPPDSIDAIFHKLNSPEATRKFYSAIKNSAVWFNGSIRTERADSLLSFLRDTRYYGLLRNNYHYDIIERDLSKPESLLHLDILLTDAFLSLAKDLKYGRRPPKNPYTIDSLTNGVLATALQQQSIKKILREQEPAFRAYHNLKIALQIAIDTLDNNTRQLLLAGATNDLITPQKHIRLIEINIERWREENNIHENRYILVNIPSFLLQVTNADTLVLESRIITGTPEKQTPEISSRIECITIYPYWHVPRKIVIEEYLPLIQKDTTFLQRNNFDVLNRDGKILRRDSIDWNKFNANYFPVSLRQREGVENSLGVIKFQFDNPYAVYLHDT
ncbi:MAG TPA: L,D-transpeptidase family protein, partial [Ohtaekwangia sp.]|uniref:L,D-transpeptidase family protein n=1 Tax=Ohtaekwangia sp. TaxID=2066019 RepID=UPI002F92CF21